MKRAQRAVEFNLMLILSPSCWAHQRCRHRRSPTDSKEVLIQENLDRLGITLATEFAMYVDVTQVRLQPAPRLPWSSAQFRPAHGAQVRLYTPFLVPFAPRVHVLCSQPSSPPLSAVAARDNGPPINSPPLAPSCRSSTVSALYYRPTCSGPAPRCHYHKIRRSTSRR